MVFEAGWESQIRHKLLMPGKQCGQNSGSSRAGDRHKLDTKICPLMSEMATILFIFSTFCMVSLNLAFTFCMCIIDVCVHVYI